MSKSNVLLWLYALVSVIEITGNFLSNEYMIFATKPLLMPILMLWFAKTTHDREGVHRLILLCSIFFAFLGDTFLLFFPKYEICFLLGLGSFLIGQLLYGIAFMLDFKQSPNKGDKRLYFLFAIIFGTYYFLLMSKLWHSLGEFLVPVIVYGLAICFMGLTAAYRYNKVNMTSYFYVLGGALLFVFSDSVIAINQFIYGGEMPFAQAIIMILYCLAQYFLVVGSVRHRR